jgi:hypothetical protein
MPTQIANQVEDDILLVGASNGPESYILWQVGLDEPEEIHFEYDDQINGNYDNVDSVRITKEYVRVQLSGDQDQAVVEFPLEDVAEVDFHKLLAGLREVYRDRDDVLEVMV